MINCVNGFVFVGDNVVYAEFCGRPNLVDVAVVVLAVVLPRLFLGEVGLIGRAAVGNVRVFGSVPRIFTVVQYYPQRVCIGAHRLSFKRFLLVVHGNLREKAARNIILHGNFFSLTRVRIQQPYFFGPLIAGRKDAAAHRPDKRRRKQHSRKNNRHKKILFHSLSVPFSEPVYRFFFLT